MIMRKTFRLWPAFLLLACLSGAGAARATDVEPYPGTDWSVDVPEGFALQKGQMPFFGNASGSAIVLMQVPTLEVETTAAPVGSPSGPPPDQIMVAASQALTLGNAAGNLVEGQKIGQDLYVIMIKLATPHSKMVAIGMIPKANPTAAEKDPIRQALLSATEQPSANTDETTHFPFVVGDSAGLTVGSAVSGTTLILTEGPDSKATTGPDDRSALIVYAPLSAQAAAAVIDPAAQLETYARVLQDKDPTVEIQSTNIEDGADGPIFQVLYRHRLNSGETVNSVSLMRKAGQGVLVLSGQYPDADTTAPATFDRIFKSLRAR